VPGWLRRRLSRKPQDPLEDPAALTPQEGEAADAAVAAFQALALELVENGEWVRLRFGEETGGPAAAR